MGQFDGGLDRVDRKDDTVTCQKQAGWRRWGLGDGGGDGEYEIRMILFLLSLLILCTKKRKITYMMKLLWSEGHVTIIEDGPL